MQTVNSLLQSAEVGFAGTSSIREQMLAGLKSSKEYREGFIEEAIRSRITAQISALRQERGWDLKAFAGEMGKKISWAYRLENPNSAAPTIPSLLEVAAALDIGLDVRFCAFSKLLDDATSLEPKSFLVPSFETELKARAFWQRRKRKSGRPKEKKSLFLLHRVGHKNTEKKSPMVECGGTSQYAYLSSNQIGMGD